MKVVLRGLWPPCLRQFLLVYIICVFGLGEYGFILRDILTVGDSSGTGLIPWT